MQATPVTWKLLLEAGWEGKPDSQSSLWRRSLSPRSGKRTRSPRAVGLEHVRTDRNHYLVLDAQGQSR